MTPSTLHRDTLRFITCGSVDDGKSTLIGRLLHDVGAVPDDQVAALRNADGRMDFSLLVDGLLAEREQGITIDVAYRYFATPGRKFIIGDTPGHEQYTRNMVTAASSADAGDVVLETLSVDVSERGATRMDDMTSEASMEKRKKDGYF